MLIQRLLRYAVGTVYALNIGFWRSPTIVFEVGFVESDSKIVSWYQLALLAAVANSKIFVQKNNRPLQVELENGRSRLQNDFQILESMLRGFIAPASNADVYICFFCVAKILVGKSQTRELHPMDADLASPNEKVYGSNTLSAIGKQLFPVKKENSND